MRAAGSPPTIEIGPRAAERVRGGHPWIHREAIVRGPEPSGREPDLVRIVDRRGALLGSGFWSATAPIAVRVLAREPLDEDAVLPLLEARIVAAHERRRALLAPGQDAFRAVHGEADLLPGLFVDRYADVAVVQTGAAAMDAREGAIAEVLARRLGARLVVARDDGGARDFDSLPRRKGVLVGEGSTQVTFHDAGSRVEADVLVDGKTGGFLDQQENHARAAEYARAFASAPEALDAFAYHGGFALALARAGARVTALDESAPAVERLRANALWNNVSVEASCANAFDVLRDFDGAGRRFDLVVVDPPALAKRRSALPGAERAYKELNLRALRILRPGGILLSCSCSGKMTPERFGAVLVDAAHDAGRAVQLLERRGAGRDHPPLLGVPETEYLKCWVLRVVA